MKTEFIGFNIEGKLAFDPCTVRRFTDYIDLHQFLHDQRDSKFVIQCREDGSTVIYSIHMLSSTQGSDTIYLAFEMDGVMRTIPHESVLGHIETWFLLCPTDPMKPITMVAYNPKTRDTLYYELTNPGFNYDAN